MGSAKHALPILNYDTVPGRPDLVESFSTPVCEANLADVISARQCSCSYRPLCRSLRGTSTSVQWIAAMLCLHVLLHVSTMQL